ncbi:hypothetical protein [Roseivirga spongicola]|uniref:Uncharacterized protein n=1 Tax=Roseivirga spongicola TaxID=333140 RepID=A0A150X1Q8_9BACT|nr:hypothetical protein [Roseivirga spongicola]KYG72664.1 hypothetical protein AWW68_17360 [Roseivirga spongicola]WPZ10266.1 hypothetical protein T7867_18540 [Roseivirga spongicola]
MIYKRCEAQPFKDSKKMPVDFVKLQAPTDLWAFQTMDRKPIQYMNRLFRPSLTTTEVGFPKYWTSKVSDNEKGFYHKIDLVRGRHELCNSLWKYYHGHNACSFTLNECFDALEKLCLDVGEDAFQFVVNHLEIGVFFQVNFDLIQKVRMTYKNSAFDAMKKSKSREVYGWRLQLTQFEIKLYDVRAKQRLAKEVIDAPVGSYRFEIKYYDKKILRKMGVKVTEDLFIGECPLFIHWQNVVQTIVFKLFPDIPSGLKTSDIKNLCLYLSDGFEEFQRIVKQKPSGKTDLARVRDSVERNRMLLDGKINLKELLLETFNSNLLLCGK